LPWNALLVLETEGVGRWAHRCRNSCWAASWGGCRERAQPWQAPQMAGNPGCSLIAVRGCPVGQSCRGAAIRPVKTTAQSTSAVVGVVGRVSSSGLGEMQQCGVCACARTTWGGGTRGAILLLPGAPHSCKRRRHHAGGVRRLGLSPVHGRRAPLWADNRTVLSVHAHVHVVRFGRKM